MTKLGETMDDIGELMGFLFYVAAARHAAQGQRLQQLRATMTTVLEEYRLGRISREDVKQSVRAVMGEDWQPSGDYKVWIDKMEGKG